MMQVLLPAVLDRKIPDWRGLFRGVMRSVADRVVVFLDYQNVYKGARSCFHDPQAPHMYGQIDPLRLGQHLAAASPYDRELTQVRVYRGRPDASRDEKGYSACTRQCAIWEQDPRVKAILRTLAYPHGWPEASLPGEKPREKGIDVALAIDFVRMAVEQEYDVGILMSTDTDLKPALEVVDSLSRGQIRAEVAAWSGEGMHNRRLAVAGRRLWCHWLDKAAYQFAADPKSYTSSS
jgi:uncharacterized LabA/DUF88 family protein